VTKRSSNHVNGSSCCVKCFKWDIFYGAAKLMCSMSALCVKQKWCAAARSHCIMTGLQIPTRYAHVLTYPDRIQKTAMYTAAPRSPPVDSGMKIDAKMRGTCTAAGNVDKLVDEAIIGKNLNQPRCLLGGICYRQTGVAVSKCAPHAAQRPVCVVASGSVLQVILSMTKTQHNCTMSTACSTRREADAEGVNGSWWCAAAPSMHTASGSPLRP
jgi:hypothetical protein